MIRLLGGPDSIWKRNSGRLSPGLHASTTSSSVKISTPSPILARKIGTPGPRALIDTSALASLKKSELLRLPPGLYTLNPKDLRGLDDLIEIVDVGG